MVTNLDLKSEIDTALRARENRQPRRLTGFTFMPLVVRAGVPTRKVPQEHWVRQSVDRVTVATINCQCGTSLNVAIGDGPVKCAGESCPRSFFFDGTAVWALLSPPA